MNTLLFAGVLSESSCPSKETAESRLRKSLLDNYDYNVRPVCNTNKTITIGVRMILKSFTYVSILKSFEVNVFRIFAILGYA